MDLLYVGLRALKLTRGTHRATKGHPLETKETCKPDQTDQTFQSHPDSPPPPSYFRFYDLPLELRLQVLDIYVSTLYPRIVYRCFCHLCEPIASTTLSSKPSLIEQRDLHKCKDRIYPFKNDAKFRRRFSYCEDLPLDSNTRFFDHGSGQSFNFPYGTGARPAEPGVFIASKQLRQDAINALVRTTPFHVMTQHKNTGWRPDRYSEIGYLPAWYKESLRFAEEFEPNTANLFKLTAGWSSNFPRLREVRLIHGRVRMNTKMRFSQEKLEWVQGVPMDLLTSMVSRRMRKLMQDICITPVQSREQEWQSLWLEEHGRVSREDWHAVASMKPLWERNWKVVVLVEYRIKVRESKRSKRQWASIYVTAKEVENCRTYSLDLRLDDRLLRLKQNVESSLCMVAQHIGEDE